MTIFRKSLITLGIAVMGFFTILVVSVMVFMNSLYYEINMIGLRNTAKTLMNTIGKDKITEMFTSDTIELPLTGYDAYRLTLIATSGYVLWDSHVSESLVNHIDREEIIAALEGREGSSRRDSISTNIRRIYYALPVFDNNNVIGVFRLSLSIPGFGARVSPIFLPFVIFICLFIITAFCTIILYSHSLSTSLGRLVSIAKSNTLFLSDHEAVKYVAPEFRSLEKALRAMTEELNLNFEQAKSEGSRLEAILNGLSEAVFAMDSSHKLHLVNPKARELFNLGKLKISDMTLLEATRSMELVDIVKKAIITGEPLETEITFHSGTAQSFQVYASPLDKNVGVVLVLRDITRLVKLERIRKDFVANVSHELRTPIQLIKGFSESLMDSVSNKQSLHFIEIIRKNAETMESLTNDLLILSSLENNAINERDMEELPVAPLVNEAVSSVESIARKKNIEIIVKCQDDLNAKLHGSLITQALINLIDNGIKYSKEKSKIWVSASMENNDLVFEVKDKGIGISPEHLERIFERFYRVDRARSRQTDGGTGLGLSIVRHIALLHKGNAEVESLAGEGSIFRIRIPNPHHPNLH